jgi:chromosome segregation ATPase
MNRTVYRDRPPNITPELLEVAKHQVEQQEQLDKLVAWIMANKRDIRDLELDLLNRTTRIHVLEMQLRKNSSDVTLAAAAISDLLSDLLPAIDARVERALKGLEVLFARMASAEDALDCLEKCEGK